VNQGIKVIEKKPVSDSLKGPDGLCKKLLTKAGNPTCAANNKFFGCPLLADEKNSSGEKICPVYEITKKEAPCLGAPIEADIGRGCC